MVRDELIALCEKIILQADDNTDDDLYMYLAVAKLKQVEVIMREKKIESGYVGKS